MNYYIQGSPDRAEEIRAAFEKLGYDISWPGGCANPDVINIGVERNGAKYVVAETSEYIKDIIKTHPDYKELELPFEPKFKVGDWIVQNDNGTVSQITKIINGKDEYGEYRAYEHTNGYFAACFENEYHLWTIEDAKDGDVLVTTKIRNCPFIYRKTSRNNGLAYYYAGIDGNGNFCEGCLKRTLSHFGSVENVVPATKEQRDLLFAKMKEAGYEWDAKKKELNKIHSHYDISNFKPYQKVLIRFGNNDTWRADFFSHIKEDRGRYFVGIGYANKQCIPFEGNEHLLGTTDMPDEMYINW